MSDWSDLNDWKPGWRDRIYWWFRGNFTRRKCDGCEGNFTLNRVDPVSGDYWLCRPCAIRWYPEFFGDKSDHE